MAANAIAVSVALVQIPRGAHYVSDVAAGAAIGLAAEAVVNAAFDRLFPGKVSTGDVLSGEPASLELVSFGALPGGTLSGKSIPDEMLPGAMLSEKTPSSDRLSRDARATPSRHGPDAQDNSSPVAPYVADTAISTVAPIATPNVASAADIIVAPRPGA
jgi:hypothetical protein